MKLYRRGRVWWVTALAGDRRIRQSTGTASKAEARRFADGLELATKAPTFAAAVEFLRLYYAAQGDGAGGIPLGEAWTKYEGLYTSLGRGANEKTLRLRHERMDAFIGWLSDNAPRVKAVEQVDGPTAAAFARHLADAGKATKTRRCWLSDLGGIWSLLAKVSPDLRNPWQGLAPRDTDGERLDAFTDEEVTRILAAAESIGHGWPLACRLALETGLRYGDIACLRWDEVVADNSVIRKTPAKTARHGIRVAVPIVGAATRAALAEARSRASGHEQGTVGAEFVLPEHAAIYGDEGRGRESLRFADVLEAADVSTDTHTFHSFRHTFRTRLAAAGVDTDTAMRLCGHTDRTTSARYDHDEHLDTSRRAIEAALAAKTECHRPQGERG